MTNIQAFLGTKIGELNTSIRFLTEKSFRDLTRSLYKNADVVGQLTESFKRADNLQKQTLKSNISMNEFVGKNTQALSKLRGGFFENAEELFKNFEAGIRDNTDETLELQNKMKLTGQSTDLLRKATLTLTTFTGNNTEAAAKIAKTNMELSLKTGVTNETLLQVIESNKQLLEIPSLMGDTEPLANAMQELKSAIPSISEQDLSKTLSLLFSTEMNELTTRFALGIGDSLDRVTQSGLGATAETKKAILEAAEFAKKTYVVSQGSLKNELTSMSLDAIGNKDQILALIRVAGALENPAKTATMSMEERYYNQASVYFDQAKNFFEKTTATLYSPGALPAILKAVQGYGVGIAAGYAGRGIGALFGAASPMFMRTLGLLGPLGAIAGLVLPSLLDLFKSSDDTEKKQLEEQKKQTELQRIIAKQNQQRSDESLSRLISNALFTVATKEQPQQPQMDPGMKAVLDKLAGTLDDLNKNKGGIYFGGGRLGP